MDQLTAALQRIAELEGRVENLVAQQQACDIVLGVLAALVIKGETSASAWRIAINTAEARVRDPEQYPGLARGPRQGTLQKPADAVSRLRGHL
jgi:transposase